MFAETPFPNSLSFSRVSHNVPSIFPDSFLNILTYVSVSKRLEKTIIEKHLAIFWELKHYFLFPKWNGKNAIMFLYIHVYT